MGTGPAGDKEEASTVPLVTLISPSVRSLTASLKVIVTGIGLAPVGLLAVELTVTVGATWSEVRFIVLEAVFALPAKS